MNRIDPVSDNIDQAALGLERLASLLRAQARREGAALSLSPTQQAVLSLLQGASDGLRVGDLARRIGVSAASASDTIAALEARKLVQRERDPADARAVRVHLRPQQDATTEQTLSGFRHLIVGLGAHDRGALLRLLQLLVVQAQHEGLADGWRTCLGCRFFRPNSQDDPATPHFCAYVQRPFGNPELKADCADHQPAAPKALAAALRRFTVSPATTGRRGAPHPM